MGKSYIAKQIDEDYRRRIYYENKIKKKDEEKCDKRIEKYEAKKKEKKTL